MLSLDEQNGLREAYRAAHPGWQPATELYAAWVRVALGAQGRLLDIGCGRGGLVEQLEHPLPLMVGVDPDWESLREHRLALGRAAAWSDGLPFAAGSFDVVCASWVLEHLERPLPTFAAVARVLRPGGVFVFITPNGRHPLALLNRMLGRLGRVQGALVERLYGRAAVDTFPTYYRANTVRDLVMLCQQSELELVRVTAVADPTYLAFNRLMYAASCRLETAVPPSRRLHLVGMVRKPA